MSYINKEKILETLQSHLSQYNSEPFDECGFEGGWREAIEQAISDVEDMPEEDVRPIVRSGWKYDRYGRRYCPRCGFIQEWQPIDSGNGLNDGMPFCALCGAKMCERVVE